MARELVTGAAGFIGARVAEQLLKQGNEVVGLDNLNDAYDVRLKDWRLGRLQEQPAFQFRTMDILDRAKLESVWALGPFEAVFNLAARAGVRTREVPVSYRGRIGKSKISGTFWGSLRAGWKILSTIARYGLFDRCSQPANSSGPSQAHLTRSASTSSGGPKHFALPAPHLTPPRKTAR